MTRSKHHLCLCLTALLLFGGCRSSSYAKRGTFLGALGGAGIGALVGRATGHTGAGAVIGTGVGAVTGAAAGSALDDIESRNRAQIAAQLGRPVAQGAATITDVADMTQAGVDPQLIINYINSAGVSEPLLAADVIYLHEKGVRDDVIQAMQNPRVARVPQTVIVEPPARTVIIHEDPYWPYCEPHYNFSFGGHCCH